MPKRRKLTLLEQLAGVADPTPTDVDPDTLDTLGQPEADADVSDPDYDDETVEVGESQLRRALPMAVTADPMYQGVAVSRDSAGFDDDDASEEFEGSEGSEETDQGNDDDDDDDDEDELDGDDEQAFASALGGGDGKADNDVGDLSDGLSDDDDDDDELGSGLSAALSGATVDDEERAHFESQFAELEKAEREAVQQMAANPSNDTQKGEHVREQLSMWDALVEARIRMQPALQLANRLPQRGAAAAFDTFCAGEAAALKSARSSCHAAITALFKLQEALLARYPATAELGPDSRKRPRDESPDELLGCIDARHAALQDFSKETLEKWFSRTNLARSKTNSKRFKALDLSVMKQIEQVMADRTRVVKRTQLRRSDFTVIGAEPKEAGGPASVAAATSAGVDAGEPGIQGGVAPGAVQDREYSTELFDDGDFYHDILRELIERKAAAADASDPVAMGRHWVELSKLRKKVKRKVDTKASKGRKLRYEVHEKLVNFMAPDPTVHDSTDKAKDDLYASLFQPA